MRILASDGDRVAEIADLSELGDWNAEAGPGATYALVTDAATVRLDGLAGPVEAEDILEMIVHARMPADARTRASGCTLHERYTCGDCELLATALGEVIEDGWTYAVSEPARNRRKPDMLVHAGLCLPDGRIVDVEGVHDLSGWAGRWGENADTDLWEHGDVSPERLARMQGDRAVDVAGVAAALPLARLVAGLSGLSPSREPEAAPGPRR